MPGKRAGEKGSCRKKTASKRTSSEQRFVDAREEQLDRWQERHPRSRRSAAQHLAAPGTKRRAKSAARRTTKPRTKRSGSTRTRRAPT
ncbi:hypothetical protein DB32_008915 [Sandaracinus amylolyticus]|uniref:Uncharacterized protein n=1 Tax=Sandaracinus amylolyticus TaxID=927083 RepID=A0A0F6YMU7_9BACT|nr:hypothetical protein DB32_008915 [Sandaracinus amylolyticus]